jgi:hypothetical protein
VRVWDAAEGAAPGCGAMVASTTALAPSRSIFMVMLGPIVALTSVTE